MPSRITSESASEDNGVIAFDSEFQIDLEMGYHMPSSPPEAPEVESPEGEEFELPEPVSAAEEPHDEETESSSLRRRRGATLNMPSMVARILLKEPKVQYALAGYKPLRFSSHIPPPNFGAVIKGKVYRSGFPTVENLNFMESLGLRTILTLVEGPYPEDYTEWISENFKDHHKIPLPANKDFIQVKTSDLAKAMAIVTDPDNYPLLIHCNKGKHRTGCVVGAFRKCAGYSMSDILSEYNDYASNKARELDEKLIERISPYELMYPLPPSDMYEVFPVEVVPHQEYYAGTWISYPDYPITA